VATSGSPGSVRLTGMARVSSAEICSVGAAGPAFGIGVGIAVVASSGAAWRRGLMLRNSPSQEPMSRLCLPPRLPRSARSAGAGAAKRVVGASAAGALTGSVAAAGLPGRRDGADGADSAVAGAPPEGAASTIDPAAAAAGSIVEAAPSGGAPATALSAPSAPSRRPGSPAAATEPVKAPAAEAPTTRFAAPAPAERADRGKRGGKHKRDIGSWLGELRNIKPRRQAAPEDATTAIPTPIPNAGPAAPTEQISAEETRAIPVSRTEPGDPEVATEQLNARAKQGAHDLLPRDGR